MPRNLAFYYCLANTEVGYGLADVLSMDKNSIFKTVVFSSVLYSEVIGEFQFK